MSNLTDNNKKLLLSVLTITSGSILIVLIQILFFYSSYNDLKRDYVQNSKKNNRIEQIRDRRNNTPPPVPANYSSLNIHSYSPMEDSVLAIMYDEKYRTYTLLLGKSQYKEIIRQFNPQMDTIPREDDAFKDGQRVYFPLNLLPAQPGHKKYFSKNKGTIIINLDSLDLHYYHQDTLLISTKISMGQSKVKPINLGKYKLDHKQILAWSALFDSLSMPWALHVYGNYYIHAGEVISGKDSHGCIRVPYIYARELYNMVKKGDSIVIVSTNKNYGKSFYDSLSRIAKKTRIDSLKSLHDTNFTINRKNPVKSGKYAGINKDIQNKKNVSMNKSRTDTSMTGKNRKNSSIGSTKKDKILRTKKNISGSNKAAKIRGKQTGAKSTKGNVVRGSEKKSQIH